MKKIGIILSGCGAFDGAEIHESVLTIYYLNKAGAELSFYAPDVKQLQVINHHTQQITPEENRNVLEESARIARGPVNNLSDMIIDELDAVVIPGGFGSAANLSTFAVEGKNCKVNSELIEIIKSVISKGKVLGVICISPILVACALKDSNLNPTITIGSDEELNDVLAAWNATPVIAQASEVIVDERNKRVTTPAYMLAENIVEVGNGIEKFTNEIMRIV